MTVALSREMLRFIALLALLVPGCSDGSPDEPPVGVYSEFLGRADIEPALPALAARRADLNIALPADGIGDPEMANLLRTAEAERVGVRLWLVLSREDGYWPNEENAALFRAEVTRLLDWLSRDGLKADAVVYDLEPSYAYTTELRGTWDMGLDQVEALMRAHMDPAAFAAGRAELSASVAEVQARGLRAACVTYPQVLDDLLDGDDDLQDALDIPVRDVPFDEVAFMVYQTAFAEAVGAWIGPGLVASFASDARAQLGDRAVIALGQVGAVGIFEPTGPVYEDPEVLSADVAAALAEGIGRIEIYSLDGMLRLGGAERWLTMTAPQPAAALPSGQARIVRSVAASLDERLDTSAP